MIHFAASAWIDGRLVRREFDAHDWDHALQVARTLLAGAPDMTIEALAVLAAE